MSNQLKKISAQVDPSISAITIAHLLSSGDTEKKLLALMTIRKKLEQNSSSGSSYFDMTEKYLNDSDEDCKWQSFVIAGHFMETEPSKCWQVITTFGDSNDQDTRAAVATVLLEHYFETNPQLFDSKFREYKQLIKAGHSNLLQTLSMCRSTWGSIANSIKVEQFLESENCGV